MRFSRMHISVNCTVGLHAFEVSKPGAEQVIAIEAVKNEYALTRQRETFCFGTQFGYRSGNLMRL